MDFSKMSYDELYELEIYIHCFSVMLHKLRGDVINIGTATCVSMEIKDALTDIDNELKVRCTHDRKD